ncbi:MAG: ABC-2 family transporter protein [Hespellia sp.]|nr:ABC-2 family transporter protein [Hespellia sp.]
MKKMKELVRMTFLTKFAYMKAFWFNVLGTGASIVIYYFLWQFVFQKQNSLNGFTMVQMTTYVILSRILSSQFGGGINEELSQWIYEGKIGVELLRPISLFFTLFAKRMGEFLFFLLFKGVPISILCFLILGGTAPAGVLNFILFVLSIFISIVIMFFIEFMVGICAFYTYGYHGLMFTKSALLSILSGGIVPIFLFPKGLAAVLTYMPFAGMVSVPVNIYLGKYVLAESAKFMMLQIVWALVLCLAAHLFYGHVIKKVVVQGG